MDFQMVSYADNFEDVLLQRAFPTDAPGFYIDVGAYDPVEFSVTKHFYDRGWRGINIEPNPAPFAKLRDARERDINLNIGLSDREGSLTLYEAPSAGCCWSADRDFLGRVVDEIRGRARRPDRADDLGLDARPDLR